MKRLLSPAAALLRSSRTLFRSTGLLILALSTAARVSAQVSVTYAQRVANYYGNFTTGTAGAYDQGSYQVGMYANGGGTKQVVRWRKFRTDGGSGSSSDRSLQVGDVFTITLSASRAYGRMGFALLASPSSTSSYADRENNAAISVNLDGPAYNGDWGAWYAKYGGTTSTGSNLIYGQQGPSYKNLTFTLILTAPNRMNLEITDGGTTSYFYDLLLGTSNPITDYAIFLDDDYDGGGNSNIYWGLGAITTQHSLTTLGNMPIGSSNGSFTVATALANGFAANSSSTPVTNSLTKNGTGTVTLTGTNTYTGTTTVNGGTLQLNRTGGTTIPATNSVVVNSGGNLRISSNQTLNTLTVNSGGSVTVDAGIVLTVTGTADILANPAFNGTGTVTVGAGSTLRINNSSYPGNTNIFTWNSTSTLQFANTGSSYGVGSSDTYWTNANYPGNIVVGTGGITLNAARSLSSAIILGGALTLNANLTLANGSVLTLNNGGSVTGSGTVLYNNFCNLLYNQGGAVTLGREWTGNITGTTVTVQNSTALSFGATSTQRTLGGNLNIGPGSSLSLGTLSGGDLGLYGSVTNGGTITGNGRSLIFYTNNTSSYTKTGGGTDAFGTLVLSMSSSTKTLTIAAGTSLQLSNGLQMTQGNLYLNGSSGNTSGITIGSGGSISDAGGTIDGANASYNTLSFAGAATVNTSSSLTVSAGVTTALPGSGTVSLSSSLVDNGPLTLTQGSITLGSSASLSLGGAISRGTGSISASSGSITLNGSSSQTVPSGTFSGTLKSLTVSNPSGVTLSGSNTISGSLTLASGTLGGTLTIGDGAAIVRSSGSLGTAPTFAGVVDLTFSTTGTANTGNEVPATDIIRKVSVTGGGVTTLQRDMKVNGMLTLGSGILSLGSYNLTIYADSSNGGDASAYVRTSGSGAFTIKNVAATGAVFPVGNSTYNPVSIANAVTLDWSVKVADAISNVTPEYSANIAKAVQREWDVTPSINNPAPGSATVSFAYNGTTDVGGSFSNAVQVQAWHYRGGVWVKSGSAVTPASMNGMKVVTVSGLNYFSPFSISNVGAPLPVQLMSFSGKRVNGVNELKWATATESGNRGFAIERSATGTGFAQVSFVGSRAAGGNSESVISYTFNDNAAGSKWYYRLRQTDIDGKYKYSQVVMLSADKAGNISIQGVYPNPVRGAASIRLQAGSANGGMTLQVSDMQGRILKTQTVSAEAGSSTTVSLDLEGLPAGRYLIKAVGADGEASETATIVKQ